MWRRSRCAAHWRPFLAPSMVRGEASVWGSVSGPLMPSSHARFGPAVPNLPLASGAAQAIVMLLAGAPPCRSRRHVSRRQVPWPVRSPAILPNLPISGRLFRPQSPFPRRSEVRHVWWMRERGPSWRALRVLSEYSAVNVYPKTKLGRPLGRACCFGFGYWFGWGPPPSPRPRRAQRQRHRAALGGAMRQSPNRPIARRIQSRRERHEPLRVRRFRLRRIGGVRRPSPRRRLLCRSTPLHCAAGNGHSESIAELLLCGADGAVRDYDGCSYDG
jgi:hypothetical protein